VARVVGSTATPQPAERAAGLDAAADAADARNP
jgi:hypothetical protein